jgi:hypothetical protein
MPRNHKVAILFFGIAFLLFLIAVAVAAGAFSGNVDWAVPGGLASVALGLAAMVFPP